MKKILLVEDDATLAQVLVSVLVSAGYSVVVEKECDQAFAKTHQFVPDLVVLNILLPGKNGWDLLKQLRTHPGCFCRQLPCLILSNVTTGGDDYGRAIEMGAVDYLVKANFTPGQIVARIKKILEP